MHKLFFLILFSVSLLVALPSKIVIGFNPADIISVPNGRNITPNVVITLVEEELTKSNCSKDSDRSYVLTNTENPEEMKKYREVIEESHSEMNDPASWLTPRFIAATHLLKGSAAFGHGCAMVNLRIEDRKGCIIAQKKISASGIRNPGELIIDKLIAKAASSLRYQICNFKSNEQTCSKTHYTDKLSCPYYFIIKTKKKYSNKTKMSMLGYRLTPSVEAERYGEQIMSISEADGTITLMPLPDRGYRKQIYNGYVGSAVPGKIFSKRKYKRDISHMHGVSCPITHTIGSVDDDKASIRFALTDHRLLDRERAKTAFASVSWSTLRHQGSWSYKSPSIPLREKIHQKTDTLFTMIGLPINDREDMEYTIHIRPASKKDIKEFNNRTNNDFVTIVKAKKSLGEDRSSKPKKKRKKRPDSLLGNIEESLYNSLSQEEKDEWDNTMNGPDLQDNSDTLEEDPNIDDLKMFTD